MLAGVLGFFITLMGKMVILGIRALYSVYQCIAAYTNGLDSMLLVILQHSLKMILNVYNLSSLFPEGSP